MYYIVMLNIRIYLILDLCSNYFQVAIHNYTTLIITVYMLSIL